MVGICQEDDTEGSVPQQILLSAMPQGPENQYSEDHVEMKTSKEDCNVQQQNEDMSAFRKFVSTKHFFAP